MHADDTAGHRLGQTQRVRLAPCPVQCELNMKQPMKQKLDCVQPILVINPFQFDIFFMLVLNICRQPACMFNFNSYLLDSCSSMQMLAFANFIILYCIAARFVYIFASKLIVSYVHRSDDWFLQNLCEITVRFIFQFEFACSHVCMQLRHILGPLFVWKMNFQKILQTHSMYSMGALYKYILYE